MDAEELIARTMPLPDGWEVTQAEVRDGEKVVDIHVSFTEPEGPCPTCSAASRAHDTRRRIWRHLDLLDHQAWIVCDVPRVKCIEHGVGQMVVPWADAYSRFTERFECRVIDWLKEASLAAVARNTGLSWDEVAGIQERAVRRGLERREAICPERIGVDETSFQKRHEYVTIVTDLDGSKVLNVADGRGKASLDGFFDSLGPERTSSIRVIAMDMHAPYIYSAADYLDDVCDKICFDRFHVAQMFSKAVDRVRRAESKRLASQGENCLKGTRYMWLKAVKDLPRKLRHELSTIAATATSVAQVWAIKEIAAKLWNYKSKTWARKAWIQLCKMAFQLFIPALDRVAQTIVNHLFGIENAIVHQTSNAASESINSRVQALKRRANGYRNRERFRNAIYFHLGGLDLYPRTSIHTNP